MAFVKPDPLLPDAPDGYYWKQSCVTVKIAGWGLVSCTGTDGQKHSFYNAETEIWCAASTCNSSYPTSRPPNPWIVDPTLGVPPDDRYTILPSYDAYICPDGSVSKDKVEKFSRVFDVCPFYDYHIYKDYQIRTHYKNAHKTITTYYLRVPCSEAAKPFPQKDYEQYSYSDEWVADNSDISKMNDNYCTYDGGTIEIKLTDDCIEYHRCKRKDDCTERDKPFPEITDINCTYTEAWTEDDPNASEKYYNCIEYSGWKPTGWTRLTDGTCHNTYDYDDGSIEEAIIDCKKWYVCKKCTHHMWENDSNPNIPECWDWQPGDPTSGHKIYVTEPVETEPYSPSDEYGYIAPEFPPYWDFPPFDFEYPYEPIPTSGIVWNEWPPYDPDWEDFGSFEWCDCDIKDTVKDDCGCFEKPVKNSGLSCSGYFPKDYKIWATSFCYNNSEDTR